MFAADIKVEVGRWKREQICEEPFQENEHKTAEEHALAMTAFAVGTASSILNAKSAKLSAFGSPDSGNRLAMRKKHEQSFFPDEDDEKIGEGTKASTEYGSGSETSNEALDEDSMKKNQAQDLQYDDTSTRGSEGEQDATDQEGANIATEEEDPEEYDDCVAREFLHRADQALKFSYVARDVSKAEMNGSSKALAAKDKEWSKLWSQKVWDENIVKGWDNVMWEAQLANKYIHIGKLFGICVEKGSELQDDDERKTHKYRVVFQGNSVVDQNMNEAQSQDMGSAPATVEAARMCILKGLLKGNILEQADAMQAYIQAELGGAETWVEIPEEGWPEECVKNGTPCRRHCCRLIHALYGHPDSGTYWEKHAHKKLLELGFEPAADSWPSVYMHPETDLMLVLYVDDFLMSGPKEAMVDMWKRIGKALKMDEVGPMGVVSGMHT